MNPIGFRPAANHDLLEAITWYESQQAGLGIRFFGELDRVISRIEESPSQFPIVYRSIRRALLQNFPFGIFFKTYEDQTVIIAIADLRREAGRWQRRR